MSELGSITSSRKGLYTKRSELAFISRIGPKTYFSDSNMKYLIRFFKVRSRESQHIDKSDFLHFLHEALGYMEHFFMNRVFLQADVNRDGRIDMEEFVLFMSLVLKGSKEEKIQCWYLDCFSSSPFGTKNMKIPKLVKIQNRAEVCFNCYDLNETKQLTRDTIVTLLTNTSTEASDTSADTVLDILDMILRKMDRDSDGILIFDEFRYAAMDDWLLIEAFGQCLPDYKRHMTFLDNMEKNII